MGRTNRISTSIIAFLYIGILAGCTSLSINVRDVPRDEKPGIQKTAFAGAEPRAGQIKTAAAHMPAVVIVTGFLNKPQDTDTKESSLEHTGAPDKEYFAHPVYYDTVKDPRAQGNRPIKIGTGFIIEAAGDRAIVLTNRHVQNNTDNLTVVLYNGKTYSARVLWAGSDSDPDIAFLEIKKRNSADPDETFVAAKLGDSDAAFAGGQYLMIGHPYSFFYSAHTGTLAQIRHSFFDEGDSILQINMNVYPGNSGSPLMNEQGEVDGIVFAVKIDRENKWVTAIGWAIPINSVKEKLKEITTKTESK